MPGLSFLSPWFLAGIAAIGVPVLLHLFARQTAREQPFAATRFIPVAQVQQSRRRTLTDVLLLLLRAFALLLLAVAFARPYVAGGSAGTHAPVTVVAVDTSFSMAAPETWKAAVAMATDVGGSAPAGGAVAVVAFDGAYERQWSAERRRSVSPAERTRLRLRHWREELGRTIDYLASREDIDAGRLGVFGISHGASGMVPLLAVEKRIGAAVLYSGGTSLRRGLPDSEQQHNYLPRVTQPVLMLNGRWDIDSPPESQQRQFELLGAPADRKKHVVFEAGHGNLPRFQVEKEALDWFDRYLGSPTR